MPNGKQGDNPLSDLTLHGAHPFPGDIEEMLLRIDALGRRPGRWPLGENWPFSPREFDWKKGKGLAEARRLLAHLIVMLELRTSRDKNPDVLITGFMRLSQELPSGPRRLWHRALTRDFNIGIRGGLRPHCLVSTLKPETVRVVAQAAGRSVITIYSAQVPEQAGG